MRTSKSHPLQIATIPAGPGMGAVGVTFCPGKTDRRAATGAWARDLTADLWAIHDWGAAAVVTLMERFELDELRVSDIGDEVRGLHMEWRHLPIQDVSAPDAAFEEDWVDVGEALRGLLRAGCNVLLHCRGGLGRSGMMAARLLVELGWDSEKAIEAVRQARPGAIETGEQLSAVRQASAIPPAPPDPSGEAVRDRARGSLLGLAVGDAVGTALEFSRRDSKPRVVDMLGGGPFNLNAGEWTDDTAMALALGHALLAAGGLGETDLMDRFVAWHERGEYSCTGTCFDIGHTTRAALERYKSTGDPVAGSTHPRSAGNGSLMRLSPVAIRFRGDLARMMEVAERQSCTTHAAEEAVDACVAYAELLAEAIDGRPKHEILAPRPSSRAPRVAEILAGSWSGRTRPEISSSGYVIDSMEAALWCVGRSTGFREAILLATNLADDADTVAAITGQLAGAIWGASAIPEPWLAKLAWGERITKMADDLLDGAE